MSKLPPLKVQPRNKMLEECSASGSPFINTNVIIGPRVGSACRARTKQKDAIVDTGHESYFSVPIFIAPSAQYDPSAGLRDHSPRIATQTWRGL